MKKTFNKFLNSGFTLIELLVVIAIIGILSSIVLASLNTARGKGADAAAKSDLDNMRAQAELIYDNANPNSYAGVCTDATVVKAITNGAAAEGLTWTAVANNAIAGNVAAGCSSPVGGGTWVAWIAMVKGLGSSVAAPQIWCADNTGTSMVKTIAPAANPPVSCAGTSAGAAW